MHYVLHVGAMNTSMCQQGGVVMGVVTESGTCKQHPSSDR